MTKVSAQYICDTTVDDRWKQTVKTAQEACDANGWGSADHPVCCGSPVSVSSAIGTPYFAECKECGKFLASMFAPSFGAASVTFLDPEKVEMEDDRHWIAGTK